MDKLWKGKYKTRLNYDTGDTEASINGIWTDITGKDESVCDHRFVWVTSNQFKCHECGNQKVM